MYRESCTKESCREVSLFHFDLCFTMNDIYIVYVPQVATCIRCGFILAYSQFKTAGVGMNAVKYYSN
jgi:hypothetical protein